MLLGSGESWLGTPAPGLARPTAQAQPLPRAADSLPRRTRTRGATGSNGTLLTQRRHRALGFFCAAPAPAPPPRGPSAESRARPSEREKCRAATPSRMSSTPTAPSRRRLARCRTKSARRRLRSSRTRWCSRCGATRAARTACWLARGVRHRRALPRTATTRAPLASRWPPNLPRASSPRARPPRRHPRVRAGARAAGGGRVGLQAHWPGACEAGAGGGEEQRHQARRVHQERYVRASALRSACSPARRPPVPHHSRATPRIVRACAVADSRVPSKSLRSRARPSRATSPRCRRARRSSNSPGPDSRLSAICAMAAYLRIASASQRSDCALDVASLLRSSACTGRQSLSLYTK